VLLSPRPEHFNLDAKSESLPAPKSDEPPPDGTQAVEARHHLYTTNLQNTQPGWSRRSAGETPTERTSRASPSSASLWVLRLVEVGAEIAKMGVAVGRVTSGVERFRLISHRKVEI
jgi:hypothetical protein